MNGESVDPIEATVGDVHAAFEAGTMTAVGLVDRYLERIDAYDDELRSILAVNPTSREWAAELDATFEREGLSGPLHGIPIVLKDNHDTYDLPTTAGSEALAGSRPDEDAFVVERLRDAGAIVLAKANLQELSFGVDTVSSLGGETKNAYSLSHRPSGSSGGTAAAIAANLGLLGTGSDTCSSVRSPPAFNALVGVRPTTGLVSRTGIVPLSTTQDTPGPIARTVEDAARMLDVLVGYDPADPTTATGHDARPSGGYVSHLDERGLEGARIGVVRSFFGLSDESLDLEEGAATVTEITERAIEEMVAAGATVFDPVRVADPERLDAARLVGLEFGRDLNRYLGGREGVPNTLEAIVDSGKIHPWIRERIEDAGILDVDAETVGESREYLKRLALRGELRVDTLARMANERLDALVYPPSAVPPVALPERQPFSEMRCELAAHTGLPAIVVPAGYTDGGLPVGVELLGRSFGEPRLFELAYAYEQASGHRDPPEAYGPIG
ncbi:amidase [Natronorarus salvus]|uniref:amidase n=1 Tax=Natronorarus salvus TaxID=3117733 RepID=UPI002F25EE9D